MLIAITRITWCRPTSWTGILALSTLLLLVGLAPPAFAEGESFTDGLAAYDGGDYDETVRIWRPLAQAGDQYAQVGLAGLYLAGNGVARDPDEAARLYRLAAEQGNSDGQLNLGRLLMNGLGVSKDLVAAYAWLSLAAEQGRRWADEKRQEIGKTLSAEQLAAAKTMIENVRAK